MHTLQSAHTVNTLGVSVTTAAPWVAITGVTDVAVDDDQYALARATLPRQSAMGRVRSTAPEAPSTTTTAPFTSTVTAIGCSDDDATASGRATGATQPSHGGAGCSDCDSVVNSSWTSGLDSDCIGVCGVSVRVSGS